MSISGHSPLVYLVSQIYDVLSLQLRLESQLIRTEWQRSWERTPVEKDLIPDGVMCINHKTYGE